MGKRIRVFSFLINLSDFARIKLWQDESAIYIQIVPRWSWHEIFCIVPVLSCWLKNRPTVSCINSPISFNKMVKFIFLIFGHMVIYTSWEHNTCILLSKLLNQPIQLLTVKLLLYFHLFMLFQINRPFIVLYASTNWNMLKVNSATEIW